MQLTEKSGVSSGSNGNGVLSGTRQEEKAVTDTRHLITTPDGQKTYARIYARDFEDLSTLLAYRFVLHQNEVVVAQLKVTEQSAVLDTTVTERVQRALSYAYPVKIRYVDEIDWGNSWKQEYFGVSDAPPD